MAVHVRASDLFYKIAQSLKTCRNFRFISSANSIPEMIKSNSEMFSGEIDTKFRDSKVQNLLTRLTERSLELDKVFKPRQETLKVPTYKLLSDEELCEEEKNIREKALKRLQMPDVKFERKEIDFAIQNDPEIEGHDESKFIFTDISTSKNEMNRRIVVREPNGILREATWEERERMNYLYLPKKGQSYRLPQMLTDQDLPVVFEQLRHADVLDLVSIQCPDDSPDYLRVHRRTYHDLEEREAYSLLESTRHYGGMVYYFVTQKRAKALILRLVREDRLDDAADVVRLHHVLHPDTEHAKEHGSDDVDSHDIVLEYAQKEGLKEMIDLLKNEGLSKERIEV
ncbi:small ribosomal subunit protein mS22-like [Rhopilema esculentum]|uniref:small ribosomal subunit protein mS22-like n=1 Tax=Rhopilema esculentum TaxID=499914 RepID=UPI0031E020BE